MLFLFDASGIVLLYRKKQVALHTATAHNLRERNSPVQLNSSARILCPMNARGVV